MHWLVLLVVCICINKLHWLVIVSVLNVSDDLFLLLSSKTIAILLENLDVSKKFIVYRFRDTTNRFPVALKIKRRRRHAWVVADVQAN